MKRLSRLPAFLLVVTAACSAPPCRSVAAPATLPPLAPLSLEKTLLRIAELMEARANTARDYTQNSQAQGGGPVVRYTVKNTWRYRLMAADGTTVTVLRVHTADTPNEAGFSRSIDWTENTFDLRDIPVRGVAVQPPGEPITASPTDQKNTGQVITGDLQPALVIVAAAPGEKPIRSHRTFDIEQWTGGKPVRKNRLWSRDTMQHSVPIEFPDVEPAGPVAELFQLAIAQAQGLPRQ
jgi:hypothetical protein